MYNRVIPRDLFNDAKLLTELGFLSLAIHDNVNGIADIVELNHDGHFFDICLNKWENYLYVDNLSLVIKKNGKEISLYTNYNDKDKNALMFEYGDYLGQVFEDKELSEDFMSMIKDLS